MLVILVHHGDVVEDVFLVCHHAPQPVVDDHRQLVGEGRVVADAIGNDRREHVAVPILVLEPLSVQRGAPGGTSEQKSSGALVPGRPDEVAHALHPEH